MLKTKTRKLNKYIYNIKSNIKQDIFTTINPTLIMNPYLSRFPHRLFTNDLIITPKIKLFLKWTKLYYKVNFIHFKNYLRVYKDYKKYYKKQCNISKKDIILDLYINNKTLISTNKYKDNYLDSIYNILKKRNIPYIFILRLVSSNYIEYKTLFKLASNDKNKYIFEFDFLNYFDFLRIIIFILIYPFKTLKLLQKEITKEDIIFNVSLIRDISSLQFDSITRYFFAKKLAKNTNISNIYSWCENQSINRTFNYGIKTTNKDIKLIGLQLFINPKNYFNSIFHNEKSDEIYSPHKIYVNGKFYLKKISYIKYQVGISARYKYIFNFNHISDTNILILGSYFQGSNNLLINLANSIKNSKILFKAHPLTNKNDLKMLDCKISNKKLETLFENSKLVITSSSGTVAEALACGISTIVLRTSNEINLEYSCRIGKGIMWEYLDNINKLNDTIYKLLKIRNNEPNKIIQCTQWYKDNFFEEPTEKKILEIFSKRN